MPDTPARHRWLTELTAIPTTSGREHRVQAWVERWVARRSDVTMSSDAYGNLYLALDRNDDRAPVVATAHMDHPGFVVDSVDGTTVAAVFRGGVMPPYFEGADVEFIDGADAAHPGTVSSFDVDTRRAEIALDRAATTLGPGDIGRWRFDDGILGTRNGMLDAHACDDLAGVAASLAALDAARKLDDAGHFAVLLTRAEEEGFIGAIAAAKSGSIPAEARLLSIETSRSFPDSPIGGGPIVRVGDRSSVFDAELTNAVAIIATAAAIPHQRKLMDGGSCEATAFGAYGYRATGLCLALGNYHNMVDIDGVVAGTAGAQVGPERISIADFDGLVTLLLTVARRIDTVSSTLVDRLDARFAEGVALLG